MKQITIVFTFLLFLISCKKQTQDPGTTAVAVLGGLGGDTTVNVYGGSGDDGFVSSIALTDGGFLSAGYTSSNDGDVSGNHGSYDYWVVRTGSDGKVVWQKTYGGSASDKASGMIATADGDYVISGTSLSTDGDKQTGGPVWLIKIDGNGVMLWQKSFGVPGFEQTATDIENASGSNLAFLYNADNGQGLIGIDLYVSDGNGNPIAASTEGNNLYSSHVYAVKPVGNGYIIAGQTFDTTGQVTKGHAGGDMLIEKISLDGHLLWRRIYGGTGADLARSLVVTSDHGFLIAGSSASKDIDLTSNNGGLDFTVCKLDSNGVLQWIKTYGGSANEEANYISSTSDGNYLVSGYTEGNVYGNRGAHDLWVIKINEKGELLAERNMGGIGDEEPGQIIEFSSGHYAASGYSNSNTGDIYGAHGGLDGWLFKF